jgi:hypothetical protein
MYRAVCGEESNWVECPGRTIGIVNFDFCKQVADALELVERRPMSTAPRDGTVINIYMEPDSIGVRASWHEWQEGDNESGYITCADWYGEEPHYELIYKGPREEEDNWTWSFTKLPETWDA